MALLACQAAGKTLAALAQHLRNVLSVSDFTQHLERVQRGDSTAAGELLSLVYEELRSLAAQKMARERSGQTLQATALVHEAWLRLSASHGQQWRGREHFFSAAAEAMRRILVDNARRKMSVRHGGEMERVHVEWAHLPISTDDAKCLKVHEALDQLAQMDVRKAEVVKLRVFVGLEVREIAAALGTSEKTIQRDWIFAKAWLSRELREEN